MDLLDRIKNIRPMLADGRLANEAAVSSGVVLPILDALGWPVFDPRVVAPEYSLQGRRVDFALLTNRGPTVFVEVKQPGQSDGADRQLFEYAFHVGVPMAVLTDGATWHFYLPAEQGSYQERRVYLLNLLEREPSESAERLQRYLEYEAVVSGEAYERARHDYQRARQRREAKDALPRAWGQLVSAADERLVDLIVDEVESTSGYKPERADVIEYLRSLGGLPEREAAQTATPPQRSRVPRRRPERPGRVAEAGDLPERGFMLDGTFVPARNGRDVLVKLFQALDRRDPGFLDRFIAIPEHGRTRRYLARSPEALYPNDPSFVSPSTTAEVKPGYWLMTNASHQKMENIIKMACEVVGLQYGREVIVRMR